MRIHLLLASALLAGVALFGTGCKNDCQKALDHRMGCIEDLCSSNNCPEDMMTQMREAAGAEQPECTGDVATAATAQLALTCEQITAEFAAMLQLQNAMENAGGGAEGGTE